MIYKCKDCGQEYNIKPDFCDCGNNTFDEISDASKPEAISTLPVIKHQNTNRFKNIDIPSLLFFILCIILSVLSWIYIGENTTETTVDTKQEQVASKPIPSIDKLWKENAQKPQTITPVKTVVKQPDVVPQQKTVIPKQITQNTPKVSKPKQEKTIKTTPVNYQNQTQKTKQAEPKVKPSDVKKPEVIQTPKTSTVQLKKELDEYKIALRNRLGKSINFASVIGDGTCAVSFKVDKTGNLINRKFVRQSQNISLNDAVYKAFINTPTFREPPEYYNGETLTLSVKMYSGSFEIMLK